MDNKLEYYMSLPYKIEIEPISDEDGGGFTARLADFGKYAVVGDGETIEEAVRNLEEIKKIRFGDWLKEGKSIPEPRKEPDISECSGKFVVRVPKYLHYRLIGCAKNNGVSLNQFIVSLLSSGVENHFFKMPSDYPNLS